MTFVVPSSDKLSPFGSTSPEPSPAWRAVADQMAARLPGFDDRISSSVVLEDHLAADDAKADVVVALGVGAGAAAALQAC